MRMHVAERTVSSFAALHLDMLRPRRASVPFPFDQENITYFYLARNGIHALAEAWHLRGQEVLVPSYCHGVEMKALLHAGVRLRYYPVHAGMTVSMEDIAARVTPATRGVYLIHYVGFPGPIDELADFCRRRRLLLIEDCALALLSKNGDVPLGTVGDAAVFCLYKTLPLPNGGAVVLRDGSRLPVQTTPPSLASTLSYSVSALLREHYVTTVPSEDGSGDGPRRVFDLPLREAVKPLMARLGMVKVATEDFDPAHASLGMSAVCRTIVAAQHFAQIVERRRRNYAHLLSRLSGVARLVKPDLPAGVCPLFFPIQTSRKHELQAHLAARGIESVNVWAAAAPGIAVGEYPEVDDLRGSVLELPCHQDLTLDDMDRIADAVVAVPAFASWP